MFFELKLEAVGSILIKHYSLVILIMKIFVSLNLYSTIIWTLGCFCVLRFDYYYSYVNRPS